MNLEDSLTAEDGCFKVELTSCFNISLYPSTLKWTSGPEKHHNEENIPKYH